MTDIEEIKLRYFNTSRELLREYPAELATFEDLWAAGKLRHAYAFVTNVVRSLGLTRSPAADQADENFFWGWMH